MNRKGRRVNVQKQETVVSALWGFADDIHKRPKKGCMCTSESLGLTLSLDHVGKALRTIMEAFGYQVAKIQ